MDEADYDRVMKEKAKKLKSTAKRLADDIGDDISKIDVEGVEKTVKKDTAKLRKSTKKAAIDVLDGLEKAAAGIRKELNKDEK
jgi:hypothetical protein